MSNLLFPWFPGPFRRRGHRLLRWVISAVAVASSALGGELVFRSDVVNPDARADAFVRILDNQKTLDVPLGSFLEYDIYFSSENVSFGGGVCLITRKGSVIKDPCPKDQHGISTHFEGGAPDLERMAKGKWYHRKIPLDSLSGVPADEVFLAASAAYARKAGQNEVHYRDICLTDASGRKITDLMPGLGSIPYPLVLHAPYVRDISVEAPNVVSGSFQPDRYLLAVDEKLTGSIVLKNFDPGKAASVAYNLKIERISDGTVVFESPQDSIQIAAGAESSIPVKLEQLVAGNYRVQLYLAAEDSRAVVSSAAITSMTKEAIAARPKPFSKRGFAMGSVGITGGDSPQTLPLIRELGANFYQVRVDWAQIEPAPGQYDVSRIQGFAAMARRCGMSLEIDFYSGFPSYSVPLWYRGDVMSSNTGKNDLGNRFAAISYWAPARQAGLKALQYVLEQCNASDVVAWNAWQGGNFDSFYLIHGSPDEVGMQDYSKWSQERFRGYVREKMGGSLEKANERYGLHLLSWDELQQPSPDRNGLNLGTLWSDFMEYRSWSVERAQKEASALLMAGAPKAHHEYFYGGGMERLGINGNDYDVGLRNSLLYNGSLHHTASPGAENNVYLGTVRRQFGIPFSIETAGTPANPAEHQHAMFELLSQNASAYTYIQWIGRGLVSVPGADLGFGEFRPALERMQNAKPAGSSVAVVYPYSNMIIDPWNRILPGVKAAERFIRRMETVGYDTDVYTDRTENVQWAQYPLVVVAFSSALAPNFVKEIATYVEQGGKIVLLSDTGEHTPGDKSERFALLKKLGIASGESERKALIGKPMAIFNAEGLENLSVELSNWRPLPPLPKDAKVWALDKAGAPSVATWKRGQGEVMIWAGWPNQDTAAGTPSVVYGKAGSYATAVTAFPVAFDKVIENFAGVKLPMTCATPDVLFALRKQKNNRFVVLLNNSNHPTRADVSVPLPPGSQHAFDLTRMAALEDVVAKEGRGGFSVDLEPLEVAVVQLSPEEIKPPVVDFPLRARRVLPPETALSGAALQKMFLPASAVQARPGGRVATTEQADLRVSLPSPGRYQLLLQTATNAPAPMVRDDSGTVLSPSVSEAIGKGRFSIPFEAKAEEQTLRFPKGMLIDWIQIQPAFRPVGPALVSPVQENPGAFPGLNFQRTTDIESDLIRSGTPPDGSEWHKVIPGDNGAIFLKDATGSKSGLAYVSWQIEAPKAIQTILGIGTDYGLKLWLNGEQIFDSTQKRRKGPAEFNEFNLPVTLKEGTNILFAKTVSGADGWFVQVNSNLQKAPTKDEAAKFDACTDAAGLKATGKNEMP